MSNGWIDISECTEGYWLFKDISIVDAIPVEVKGDRVWSGGLGIWVRLNRYTGKALKLCDLNNNGINVGMFILKIAFLVVVNHE